ncbi:MAG TPA: site-2 protease family protein, partial [Nitrospira sp.]|nr:site-2 protease family protein [Nitrospira sp.]
MDFTAIPHYLLTAVVFVVMLCVLVAAHEYGHYLLARLFGMGVEEFAIGFGKKPIWTWMRKTYSVQRNPGPAGPSVPLHLETSSYPTDGSSALQPEPETSPTPSQVKLTVQETTDFTIRPWPLGGFVRIKGMVPEEDGSETKVPGGFYSKAPWKRFIVLLAGPVFSVLAGVIILFGLKLAMGEERRITTLREIV